jgi:hypothetical protein
MTKVDAHERVIGVVSSTDLIPAQSGMRCAAEREILMEQTPSATSWRRSRS